MFCFKNKYFLYTFVSVSFLFKSNVDGMDLAEEIIFFYSDMETCSMPFTHAAQRIFWTSSESQLLS